jgi:site-specific recombinase XerD
MTAASTPTPLPEPPPAAATPADARGPAKAGVKKRRPQRLPRSLTAADREALLAQPNPRALTGVRDRALIATMLRAGLRCSEALLLRQRDIDLDRHRIRVFGKGSKERVVPIDPLLEAHLREWRARRPSGERFFNTVRGDPKGRPLDAREVRRMVKRRGLKAGINDLHPHLLRHTCATSWIEERGLELHEVQLLLGHARLTTTQRYLHASVPSLVDKFRRFS